MFCKKKYRLLGLLPSRLHLFGAENERIYLLGSDVYVRDQLSRFLYGEQVSFFFSSRRRHMRSLRDWSSDVCSSDLAVRSSSRPRSPRKMTIRFPATSRSSGSA